MKQDRIVREPERRSLTGLSRTAWWDEERRARERGEAFPFRLSLIGGRVGWRLSELQKWMRRLQATRPGAA